MTTIAFDGYDLACDGRTTIDTFITSDSDNKIYNMRGVKFRNEECLYFVSAGSVEGAEIMRAILISQFDDPKLDVSHTRNTRALLFTKNSIYENEGLVWTKVQKELLTLGSGRVVAKSAMILGLNAKQAVAHAIKLDSASGGKIRCVNVYPRKN